MLCEFRKTFNRNKGNILLLGLLIIIFIILINRKLMVLNTTFEISDHFNILTINSILAGFLFTGLGIMISGLSRERVLRLDNEGYLDKYYFAVYTAIMLCIISIISSIFLIFNFAPKLKNLLLFTEQIGLITGVIFFIKCMNNLRKIINKIRKSGDVR